MKIMLLVLMFVASPVLALTPNLDCKITNAAGKFMIINTIERFGFAVDETPTTLSFKSIDYVDVNEVIVTNMYIDKTTLLGRITAQLNGGKTHTAKVDCNY